MDILHLVDRLEEAVKQSRRVPASSMRLLDERKILALIDQMRISIPEDVRRAQRMNQEKERTMAQARAEAEKLVRAAEERVNDLIGEHRISQAAEEHATSIRAQAAREATSLRTDADEYVFNTLCQLEEELRRVLRVVENGLRKIQDEKTERDLPR